MLALASCSKRGNLFERMFGLDEIPTFQITLSPDAADALARHPREWVGGGFAYGDDVFDHVGVRLKGHRTLRKLGDKPSFKIKLDRYEPHALAGATTLTLNNMAEDPSLMREVLAYRLYRALGVAAPNAGFAEVSVNGRPQGLYAVIETVDKKFLRKRFADATGPMYEGNYGCDVIPDDVTGYDLQSGPEDRSELARFAQLAAGDPKQLFGAGSSLDVPAFLRFLAVEMYVSNFDGYRHGHNYRIYFDPTRKRWSFMPWGLDRTFVKNMSIFDSHGWLATRCFADAACKVAYLRTMRDVVAEARRLHLETGVDVIHVVTQEAAKRDKHHRASELASAQAALRTFLVDRPAEVERELGCLDAAGNERDRDGDGYACLDCDDANPAIHPGATEVCDGADNDCNGAVDDAPCACQAIDIGTSGFSLCDVTVSYTRAQQICAGLGAALAHVDSADEERLLNDATAAARQRRKGDPRVYNRWWIGLDDRAVEGQFRWSVPGSTFTSWHRGEPDNAGCNQDCVVLDSETGLWSDTHCLDVHPFICRK